MKVLILGGTLFLGRHLVESALARGHEVTLFNRGRTNPDLYPEVEKLHGDRDSGDLGALHRRNWDAAIDTCGYVPRIVRESAELLAGAVGRYVFVSSLSVFTPPAKQRLTERDPVHPPRRRGERGRRRPTTARSRLSASKRSRTPSRAARSICARGS